MNRDIGEDLAVDLDIGLLQASDEAAVGHAIDAGRSVDTRDPQGTELTLADTTVTVSVLAGLDDSLLGYAEDA